MNDQLIAKIDPGQLRHRVTLMRATLAPDAAGEDRETWASVGTYWALVTPLTGRELTYARQVIATVSHRITIRNVGTITAANRLVFEGRTLELGSVTRVGEINEYYSILATEQPSTA
jgi:SPP1 family predicted phage head-tail adaptor